jgi:hypothetical protein
VDAPEQLSLEEIKERLGDYDAIAAAGRKRGAEGAHSGRGQAEGDRSGGDRGGQHRRPGGEALREALDALGANLHIVSVRQVRLKGEGSGMGDGWVPMRRGSPSIRRLSRKSRDKAENGRGARAVCLFPRHGLLHASMVETPKGFSPAIPHRRMQIEHRRAIP